jgi:cytoskeletal protein CcmA (bactofilin family)
VDSFLGEQLRGYLELPRLSVAAYSEFTFILHDEAPTWEKYGGIMWTSKQPQTDLPVSPSVQELGSQIKISNTAPATRLSSSNSRDVACLGSSLVVKGEISGSEDLQIDGTVEGPISLQSQRVTVGPTARLNSEVRAREVVIYGSVEGNLNARDRVEIRKDGSVIGDITTARISIEDGAYFKGRIEIDRGDRPITEGPGSVGVPTATATI